MSNASAAPSNPGNDVGEMTTASVVRLVGRVFAPLLGAVAIFGQHMILLGRAFTWLFRRPFRLRLYLEQMEFIGVGSMPIIMLVGFFSGAVTALQAITALAMFDQQRWVGYGVGVSLARELAPVFTALMITARAGSAMATELGSMRITEQIDALTTFAVNPVHYLVTPRLVAAILMLPIMTMVFNVLGLLGAYIISILVYQIDFGQVLELFRHWVDPLDYVQGLIKSVIFGVAMALAACYQGFNVRGGAKEVGRATTAAVVSSSVSVLILDYFLIEIMNVLWPPHGM
jgi:phospholipid/cholesterol/gamma-HCH transport system permease protein